MDNAKQAIKQLMDGTMTVPETAVSEGWDMATAAGILAQVSQLIESELDEPDDMALLKQIWDALIEFIQHESDEVDVLNDEEQSEEGKSLKKNMDKNVGGGVDRDKIPAEDFAGKNCSFPIVKPGDVSDAASSIGRAGPDNYSSDVLKANIIKIAKRKGAAFVAELPKAWTEDEGEVSKIQCPHALSHP